MEPIQNIISKTDYKTGEKISRVPHAALCALIVASLTITALTIGADLVPLLKNWLKATFFHHWIGKGVLALVVFIISFLISLLFAPTEKREQIVFYLSAWIVALSTLAIVGFFLYEAFFLH
ncbi:MAG: hypothetical protein AAB805_02190 [Patescibacteria group bacterium]